MRWLQYLPEHWKQRVRELALQQSEGRFQSLGATAFTNQTVGVRFPDGSDARFRNAFFLIDKTSEEALVLTEHCGYHIFPLEELQIEVLDKSSSVQKET